jgi:hypothetical protein
VRFGRLASCEPVVIVFDQPVRITALQATASSSFGRLGIQFLICEPTPRLSYSHAALRPGKAQDTDGPRCGDEESIRTAPISIRAKRIGNSMHPGASRPVQFRLRDEAVNLSGVLHPAQRVVLRGMRWRAAAEACWGDEGIVDYELRRVWARRVVSE